MVWSPLNDNTYKRKGGVSNLDKGSSDLLFVYDLFIYMSIRKEISRIKILLEGSNKPSEESYLMALKDVRVLIPVLSHKIIHKNKLNHDDETMIKLNKELFEKVKYGDDEVLDELWEIAGTLVLRNAINIITHYHK